MSSKEIDSVSSQCAVCFKKTTKSCSACSKVFYCGKNCQIQERKQHKLDCFPAAWVAAKKPNSKSDTQLQLIATRNIEKGDLILKEKAIASGPLGNTSKEYQCIVCGKKIGPGKCYRFVGFLWAICSENCAETSEHFSRCRLLTLKPTREDSNKIVTTDLISCCESIKKNDPKVYEQVCKLVQEMLNLETSKSGPNISLHDLLSAFYKNPCVNNEISHLFRNASLLTHNCLPNARILISKDTKAILLLKAILPIKKGQVISISYENSEYPYPTSLMGLLQRQTFLQNRFNFDCCCLRCNDLTDLGTFSLGIKCNQPSCTQGYLLPNIVFHAANFNKEGKWICNKCGKTRTSDEISNTLEKIKQESELVDNIKGIESLLAEYENNILHSNHYSLNQLRYLSYQKTSSKFVDHTKENSDQINAKDMEKLYGYISKLLTLADTISPGLSLLQEKLCDLMKSVCCELSTMYSEEGNLLKYVIKLKENQKYSNELLTFQHYLYSENTNLERNHQPIKDTTRTFINLDDYFGKEPKCAVCSKPSPISEENSCSSCKSVFYCSSKHKKSHSRQHLNEDQCFPVVITEDSAQGRFLVATRDIEKDELILREKAIISSPSSVGGAQCNLICLGCYRSVKTSYTCRFCKWPVCDEQCENSLQHSKECLIFSENSVAPVTKNYQYEFVKALRCLLLRDTDKVKWNNILSLESHAAPRKKRPVRLQLSFEAINFIRTKCKLTQFEPDIIDHVVGVNAVNAFGLQLDGGGKSGIRAGSYLFYNTCMMSHSCSPNSTSKYGITSIDPGTKALLNTNDYSVCVYANQPIRRGESVTTTYVDLSKSTLARQRLLYDGYFFCCSCERCADPSELQSLMNMLL